MVANIKQSGEKNQPNGELTAVMTNNVTILDAVLEVLEGSVEVDTLLRLEGSRCCVVFFRKTSDGICKGLNLTQREFCKVG